MSMRNMSSRQAGFTVVETLFVLAVAGIILLIVFLAIPQLVRNGRNNQRTEDVQIILQAVSRYELNHAGTLPGTGQLRGFLNTYEKDKLTFYDPSGVTVNVSSPTNGLENYPTGSVGLNNVEIDNHAKCLANGTADNRGAGYSDVAALYQIESGSGGVSHCQQL